MDQCPHCGKALRADAESCPHCGSDFETGWNPDADYYNLDLPSDDEAYAGREPTPRPAAAVWDTVIGAATVALAALFFLLVPSVLTPRNLVVVAILGISLWVFLVKTKGGWQGSP